jgi:hypothetical protein
MGKQTEFNYGWNEPSNRDYKKAQSTGNTPDYHNDYSNNQFGCNGLLICDHCGKTATCGEFFRLQVLLNEVEASVYPVRPWQLITEAYNNNSPLPIGEDDNMIPRRNENASPQGNQQSTRRGRRSGLRYLNADMLSSAHQIATIVDAKVQPDKFRSGEECVVVKLKFKGEYVLWTLRPSTRSDVVTPLEIIGDCLGDNEQEWKGNDIELYLEEDSFDGRKWIRVDVVPQEKAITKKR